MKDSQGSNAANGVATRSNLVGARPKLIDNLQVLNFSHLLYFWAVARDGSIAGACERLHLSQPTISMQIRKLEQTLGHRLFDRTGRSLVLSDVGRTVFEYADEMFSLGRELLGTLRGMPGKRNGRLHVGIPTFLPKLVTYRLLEPVLTLREPVQLICHEASLQELVDGLARHRLDAVLTDTPINSGGGSRMYNHPLGDCDVAICGNAALARRCRDGFPESLADVPMLLPSTATAMRRQLDCWFEDQPFNPNIAAEFDDSALMKEFGARGAGVFPAPSAMLPELREQYRVEVVGRLPSLRVHYYVATPERKLKNPAITAIVERAKSGLLGEPRSEVSVMLR